MGRGDAGQRRTAPDPGPGRTAARRSRRAVVRRFVPPQHGAWAMLLLPYAVGVLAAGFAWVHVPLLVAWLAGYAASYFALLAVKTRRVGRVRAPLTLYGATLAVAGTVCLLARPGLVVFAPAFLALTLVNGLYAYRKDERSIVNDVAAVVQACLMVPVAAAAGGAAPGTGWRAALVLALYFAGTALYVKTMIRERGSTGWYAASVTYHAVAVPVAWLFAPAAGVAFALFLGRAIVLPRFPLRPKAVGLVEVGSCVLLLALARSLLP